MCLSNREGLERGDDWRLRRHYVSTVFGGFVQSIHLVDDDFNPRSSREATATLAKIMPTVSDDGPPRPPHIRSDSRQQSPKNPKNLKPILLRRLLASIPSLSRKAPASESIQRQPPTKREHRLVSIHTCPSTPIPINQFAVRCRPPIARPNKSSPIAHEENSTLASP